MERGHARIRRSSWNYFTLYLSSRRRKQKCHSLQETMKSHFSYRNFAFDSLFRTPRNDFMLKGAIPRRAITQIESTENSILPVCLFAFPFPV
jgi:hypothetical protein